MKRKTQLKLLNPVLALIVIIQYLTGLFHDQFDHETFEILHLGGAILLAVIIMIHLFLNWNWVQVNFLKTDKH